MVSSTILGVELGAGVLAALGLSAGGFAYAARWPSSWLFGKALIAPRKPGELALTFDDGPNPVWTPRLLDLLAEHNVHASFFSVGQYAAREPELLRRVADAGHLIGCHSWSHPDLAISSAARIREELRRSKETIEQTLGQPLRYFRPPFGSRRPAVFRIAREMGLTTVLWNAMTTDWSDPSAEAIASRLRARIDRLEKKKYAANIVLHDGAHLDPAAHRAPSINACRLLLERYVETHRFVRLDAWE
jgi:peptidoglycan/xylan/chitin deacetylase (PgdA/CDA1 family)